MKLTLNILFLVLYTASLAQTGVTKALLGGKVRPITANTPIPAATASAILGMTVPNGYMIETKGFTTAGDGGHAIYFTLAAIPSGLQNDSATVITLAGGNHAVLLNYRDCNVMQLGFKNDSTNIPANTIRRAQRILNLSNSTITFPRGKYLFETVVGITNYPYAFIISGERNLKIIGEPGAELFHQTNTAQASELTFFVMFNSQNITIEGLSFQGDLNNDTSFATNSVYAITPRDSIQNLEIRNCRFVSTTPCVYIGTSGHKYFKFVNNYVEDAPNSLTPCSVSEISGNTFINDTWYSTRSHAIYAYGSYSEITVTNNYFTKSGGNALKFRAENGINNIKNNVIFSNNTCQDMPSVGGCVDLGTPSSDIAIYNYIVSDNVFENVALAVQAFNPDNYTITGNTILWTLESTLTSNVGISLSGTTYRDTRQKNGVISNNTMTDTRQVVWEFKLNANPSNNDTLKIGTLLYTLKTSPTALRDIQLGANRQETVENIADKLKVANEMGGLVGVYAISSEDVRGDMMTYKFLLNLNTSLTISTNLNVTYTRTAVDYKTAAIGIQLGGVYEPIIISNNIFSDLGKPLFAVSCYRTKVTNNVFNGHQSTVNIDFQGCVFLEFTGNTITDRFGNSNAYRVDLNACFMPILHGNVGFSDYSFASSYYSVFSASYSKRTVGDGKAENIFFFGLESSDTTTQDIETWADGDQVILDSAETTLHTFTYQEQGSLGANEFNDEPSLIALIDATSQFTCTELNVNDNNAVILVRSASTGATGNNYGIRKVSDCRLCGLTLTENFAGGSASADRTIFWTPLANAYSTPTVTLANAAAAGLTGLYIDMASTLNGAYYIIRHSAAGGTEQFAIQKL